MAGIPISSSTVDGPGVPQLLNRGEQTLRAVTGSGGRLRCGMVAGNQIGTVADIYSGSPARSTPNFRRVIAVAFLPEAFGVATDISQHRRWERVPVDLNQAPHQLARGFEGLPQREDQHLQNARPTNRRTAGKPTHCDVHPSRSATSG